MEWNYGSIIRLIKEYERRNELWNPQNELYRSTAKKHEAWASLAQTFNADVVDVRRKLNSLFASFRREKSKIRQGIGTKWFLYKYMKFLPTYERETHIPNKDDENEEEHIESTEYLEENEEEEEDQNQEENQTEGEYIELTPDDNQHVIIKEEHQEVLPKIYTQKTHRRPAKRIIPPPIHGKKKIKILRRYEQDFRERHISRSEYPKKKDDCDSFGEYIADSLRKHDERTKSMIKHAINNIIFEQEMKKYSHYEIVHEIENPLVLGEE